MLTWNKSLIQTRCLFTNKINYGLKSKCVSRSEKPDV